MGFFDSVGSALASIDPGKTIGKAGESVDKAVNQIPGGWKTVGALTAAVAAPYLAPELLATEGTGALTTTELMNGAGGAFTPTAGSGASFALPAGSYTAAGASQWTPEIIAQANASSDPIGYISSLSNATPEELAAWTTPATGGMSAAQKAFLLRQGLNAFGQTTGSTRQIAGGSTSGNGMIAYQRQNPFLSTAQQNVVPDNNVALINLLRGRNV